MKIKLFVTLLILVAGIFTLSTRCRAEIYAYISNSADGSISVIDTADHKLIDTISGLGTNLEGVAISPTGNYVFVASLDDQIVLMLDTSTNSIRKEIGLPEGVSPWGVAVSPDGKFLYLTANESDDSGFLRAINTNSGAVAATIPVEKNAKGLVVLAEESTYLTYVANGNSGSVSAIEGSSTSPESPIVAGSNPAGVAVSPEGDYIYVTNRGNGEDPGSVSIIEITSNDTVGSAIDVGYEPMGIAVVPFESDSYDVYVANEGSDSISVIEIQGNPEGTSISQLIEDSRFDRPYGVSATPNGRYVYVTNKGNGTVSVIDTTEREIVQTVNVGAEPTSLGIFIGQIPPNAPSGVEAAVESNNRIQLEWSDNSSDELGFEIERKVDNDDEYEPFETTAPDAESFTDENVTETNTYYYRIRAFNGVGDSDYVTAEATIPLKAPSQLTIADRSEDSVTLKWKDRSGQESGYEIERRTIVESSASTDTDSDETEDSLSTASTSSVGSDSFTKIATVGANSTSYTDSGLESGTTYVYRVRALQDSSGETSDYSNEAEGETDDDYLCFIGTAAYGPQGSFSNGETPKNGYLTASLLICCLGFLLGKLKTRKNVPVFTSRRLRDARLRSR